MLDTTSTEIARAAFIVGCNLDGSYHSPPVDLALRPRVTAWRQARSRASKRASVGGTSLVLARQDIKADARFRHELAQRGAIHRTRVSRVDDRIDWHATLGRSCQRFAYSRRDCRRSTDLVSSDRTRECRQRLEQRLPRHQARRDMLAEHCHSGPVSSRVQLSRVSTLLLTRLLGTAVLGFRSAA